MQKANPMGWLFCFAPKRLKLAFISGGAKQKTITPSEMAFAFSR
jgi:hypothetical protein